MCARARARADLDTAFCCQDVRHGSLLIVDIMVTCTRRRRHLSAGQRETAQKHVPKVSQKAKRRQWV